MHRVRQDIITKENIDSIQTPKRICFSSTHRFALKKSDGSKDWIGVLNVPFLKSFYPIFYHETYLQLCKTKYGYWIPIKNSDDFRKIEYFIEEYLDIVFIRDTLSISIVLSEYKQVDGIARSEIGELEYRAKYKYDTRCINRLAFLCSEFLNNLPFYNDTKILCAIPSSNNIDINLPNKIVNIIDNEYDIKNISKYLNWENPKESLKELPREQKWEALNNANLIVSVDLNGKDVILIDDLYQSGLTIQYVAMKLQEAGAGNIMGLCLVKSRNDSDNL